MNERAKRENELSDLSDLLDAVHCMDNCKGMMLLPNDSIDLVVTSPPYDDLRTYGGHSWDFYGVAWNLARVLKPGGVIVWVVADGTDGGSETGTSMEQALHFKRIGLNLHDTMIYQKNSYPFPPSNRYYQQAEYMFVFSKGAPNVFNGIKQKTNWQKSTKEISTTRQADGSTKEMRYEKGKEERLLDNIWPLDTGYGRTTSDKYAHEHPAIYPDILAARHIETWSNKGDIVLDPFTGSGTTAKAAQELGRHYIGFEINPEYVEICQRRTAQATLGI